MLGFPISYKSQRSPGVRDMLDISATYIWAEDYDKSTMVGSSCLCMKYVGYLNLLSLMAINLVHAKFCRNCGSAALIRES